MANSLATSQHYRDRRFDVSKLLRIHSYHLLASASPFSNQAQALDVSITARGLHGEAYRGHIFWDEIFILPFYIQHYPDTAKQLLLYRYRLRRRRKMRRPASIVAQCIRGNQGVMGVKPRKTSLKSVEWTLGRRS